MVLEMSVSQRPRRLAATKSQQKGVSRSERDQPKSGSLARRKSTVTRKGVSDRVTAAETSTASSDVASEGDNDDDDDQSAAFESAQEESEDGDDSDGDDDDYVQSKKTGSTQRKRKVLEQKKTASKASKKAKPAKAPSAKKTRSNVAQGRGKRGGNQDQLPINKDNKIFNDVQGGQDARTTAEDWIGYYQNNGPAALAQFINFVFRCCGCNANIDEVQVDDLDSAVETLEEVQEQFKEQNVSSYPLASKAQAYKRFRRSLSLFMEQLFSLASEADLLDDEMMVDRLLAWIATLSSSPYRAIRHTSTTFALMMIGQIARLNQEARKQFEQASKLRDAEKSAKASAARIKKLNEDVHQINARRQTLDGYHKELEETVFIHRYRDSDATIRADCMEELGRWMRLCPGQFLSNSYFKYLAWELSDESATVRLTVIQSLQFVFSRQQVSSAVTLFVERVMPRMIEIAVGDVDIAVRVAMIQALLNLDQTMPFEEDDQRDQVARQIFDEDPKVRSAAARFVVNVVEDKVQESSDGEADSLRFKLLAGYLQRWSKQLDSPQGQMEEDTESEKASEAPNKDEEVASRVALAYTALWNVCEELRNWKPVLQLLQVDHTSSATGKRGAAKKQAARGNTSDGRVQLEADEEAILVDLLVAMLRKAQNLAEQPIKAASDGRSADEEAIDTAMTKDLIPALPGLFGKYKTETERISEILLLPSHMKLSIYLEQEQTSLFETLWDNVIDQFERHTEGIVIERAASAMSNMSQLTSLSVVNDAKLSAIREGTVSAVKECITSFSALTNVRAFDADDLHRLTASIARLRALCRHFDLTSELEEGEGGEQDGSAWDILLACAQRATSPRQEECQLISHALATCSLYGMWKVRAVLQQEDDSKATMSEALLTKLQPFLSLCERIVEMRGGEGQGHAIVQAEAFKQQIDNYILLANLAAIDEQQGAEGVAHAPKLPVTLHITCSQTTQAALAAYLDSTVESFRGVTHEASENNADDSLSFLRRQNAFVTIVAHFIGAIRIGVVDVRHGASLLANYGQLGHLFDACLRVLVETLREIGINGERGRIACRVILDALTKAHALMIATGEGFSDANFVNFAKFLSSSLVVRGSHLAILRSIDGEAVKEMHESAINWALKRIRQNDDDVEAESDFASLLLLKGLAQLTISLSPRDALQIKASLQRMIALNNVKVPEPSNRFWDALHIYEKRLVTIASKSDSLTRQTQKPTTPVAVRTNEGNDDDDDLYVNARSNAPSSPPGDAEGHEIGRPRPRPRQTVMSSQDTFSDAHPGLTQQDESAVDSILGFTADESLPVIRNDEDTIATRDQSGFDLSQITIGDASELEASQAALFRGLADESQTQERIVRPSRRARPSRSMRENDDEEESGIGTSRRRKRSRLD